MKNWKNNIWTRIIAIIVFILMLVAAGLSAAGLWACLEMRVYADGGIYFRRAVMDYLAPKMDDSVLYYYYDAQNNFESYGKEHWEALFSEENTNFFFTLKDQDGKVLLSSPTRPSQYHETGTLESPVMDVQEIDEEFTSAAQRQVRLEELQEQYNILAVDQGEYLLEDGEYSAGTAPGMRYTLYVAYSEEPPLTIERYIAKDFTAKDNISFVMNLVDRVIARRSALPWLTGVFSVLSLASLVVLMVLFSKRKSSWFEQIPMDLVLAIYMLLFAGTMYLLDEFYYSREWIGVTMLIVFAIAWVFLLMAFFISFAVRAREHTLWKNTITYRILVLLWKFLKWFFGMLHDLFRSLPLCWRTLLVWAMISIIEFVAMVSGNYDPSLFAVWFFEKFILTPLLLFAVIGMQRLQKGAKRMSEGDLTPIPLTHLYGPFREHGEDLNHISDGLQTAVAEQVRAERMKAELITNVSHDIKTPLTSIVNYVGLLQKEDLQNPQAAEYVTVLARQSARLKKLTEDLVEASKASTGNIEVHAAPTDLNVLLGQAAGEFADRFQGKNLELVMSAAPEQPVITADGQLLWRVFSNLMTNICKYAMPGTRVYLSTEVKAGRAIVTLRNISAQPLEKSGAELTERFVRGDRSRTGGDGSGLGLSIAQSLTELQGGVFRVTVDGDLFKAELDFPLDNH